MNALKETELRQFEAMLAKDDCTLTPYWHSRVQALIDSVREYRDELTSRKSAANWVEFKKASGDW